MLDRWIAILGRDWARHLGLMIVVVALTIAGMLTVPTRYEASSRLFFPSNPGSGGQSTSTANLALSALGGGGPDPIEVADGLFNSRRVYRAIAMGAQIDMKSAEYSVYTEKKSAQSFIQLNIQMHDPAKALAACKAAIQEFFLIRDDSSDETERTVTRQLLKEIDRAKDELAEEHIKFGILMAQKKAIPYSSADALLQTELGNVRQLELNLADAEAVYDLVKKNYSSANASGGTLPSSSPVSQIYLPQIETAELTVKQDTIKWGKESTIYQTDLAALNNLKAEFQKMLDLEKQSIAKNIAPSASLQFGYLGDLDTARKQIKLKLDKAREDIKRIIDNMPTTARESIVVQTLEQNLAALITQLELVRGQAALNTAPWQVLDPPELGSGPINRSYLKASLLGLLLGAVAVALTALSRAKREITRTV